MIAAADRDTFRQLVDGRQRFVLTTHVNPDGDAIGSQIGLARFLQSLGRTVKVVNHDPTPEVLRFLHDTQVAIETYDPGIHDAALEEAELLVLLDNSALDRLGRMEKVIRASAERVLCIDHHPTRGTPWAFNLLDEGACATAALIFELTDWYGWEPDPLAAQALYVGLATDTGFFRFNSTTPRVHEIVARLLRLRVDPARCYQEVYERNPPAHTRLLGHALTAMRLSGGGAVASVRITRGMVEQCQAADVDVSEMTTALLATDGVRIALLFRELEGGRIKVSLRSKGNLDVHHLASGFGGGGHRNASGIVISGNIESVEASVIEKAEALVAAAR